MSDESNRFRAATVRERPTECRALAVGRTLTVAARKNDNPTRRRYISQNELNG